MVKGYNGTTDLDIWMSSHYSVALSLDSTSDELW